MIAIALAGPRFVALCPLSFPFSFLLSFLLLLSSPFIPFPSSNCFTDAFNCFLSIDFPSVAFISIAFLSNASFNSFPFLALPSFPFLVTHEQESGS